MSVQTWSANEPLHSPTGFPVDLRWWAADVSSLRQSCRQLGQTHRRLADLLSADPGGAQPEITQEASRTEQRTDLPTPILQSRPGIRVSGSVRVSPSPPFSTAPLPVARVGAPQATKPAAPPFQESRPQPSKGLVLPMVLVVAGIAILLLAIAVHLA